MSLNKEMSLGVLLEEHSDVLSYLIWRGIELNADWLQEETLSGLCERWDIDWNDLKDEITEWLRDEVPRRHVAWNEPLYAGEE